ncbi:MAG: carotenoid oxygenase family protein [Acidobacteriota bacterium]
MTVHDDHTSVNPFLAGNFAPVHDEVHVDHLEVIGELPRDLHGMFLRTGPNPQFEPGDKYHWFDGDGMLHGVHLEDGVASYRNRWVRTVGFGHERDAGKKLWSGFGEMPQFESPPHGLLRKNVANTALVHHDGSLLALWEAGEPHEISLPDLETVGPKTWGGQLSCPFTAHPKVDRATGEMLFFGYNPMGPEHLHYGRVSADGQSVKIVPIEIPRGVMMHDFAITSKYTIFLDLPLVFEPMRILQGDLPFAFKSDLPSRYGIVPRHGDNGDIRWFEGPPCYMFHTLNAWDDGDEVVLVGCRTETTSIAAPPGHSDQDGAHSHHVVLAQEDAELGRLHEWRFNMATGEMKETPLDDAPTDFPRLHGDLVGHRSRYGYAARFCPTLPGTPPTFDAVVKYDVETGGSSTHHFGANRYAGEAVFAPRPGANEEDDGWVVTILRDEAAERSELIVVDAQHMDAEPVARVLLPQRVPYGFHAEWVTFTS